MSLPLEYKEGERKYNDEVDYSSDLRKPVQSRLVITR